MQDEGITVDRLLNELVGMSHTIVELKESVARYQKEAEVPNRYKAIVENIPQKIFTKDRNLVYVFCNTNYARALKIRPEEICGKTDYDVFAPEIAERLETSEKRILATGEAEELAERYIDGGQEKFVHIRKIPLKDEKESILGILAVEEEESEEYLVRLQELLFESKAEPQTIQKKLQRENTKDSQGEEFWQKVEEGEVTQRISQEITILADRGRILREKLSLEETCEHFREKISRLIQFDGVTIGVPDDQENAATLVYAAGMGLVTRRQGGVFPLSGTGEERVIKTRSALLLQRDHPEDVLGRFDIFLHYFRSGFQSILLVPMLAKDRVVGVLTFLAGRQNAYRKEDLQLAEKVGIWLAPVLAGLQHRLGFTGDPFR